MLMLFPQLVFICVLFTLLVAVSGTELFIGGYSGDPTYNRLLHSLQTYQGASDCLFIRMNISQIYPITSGLRSTTGVGTTGLVTTGRVGEFNYCINSIVSVLTTGITINEQSESTSNKQE